MSHILPTAAPFTIRYTDITKNFGATMALRGISLEFTAGRVHAVVGENGAGKSTFLGIASGRVVPTSGTITIGGEPLHTGNPRAAQNLGVHTIYQELTVIPALTPQANVFLGHETSSGGWLRESGFRTQQFPNEQRSHVDQEYHVQHRVENDSRNLRRFQHGEKCFAYGAFQ